jgi:glucose-6-phosphate dehydrogenase assembly protein OpcA
VTPTLERFTAGSAIGVDVEGIERELASLWRQSATSSTAVTRACSWNLVVLADDATLERVKAMADAMVVSVPSRTLIFHHRPHATGKELEAFVTANCRLLPGGGKLLCSEEITIESRGKGSDYLPSLTRALLVPDIPTAVLCAGLPKETALLQELVKVADRLIIDSRHVEHLQSVERLGNALLRVADLAWLRSAPWRLAAAAAFDPPVDASVLFKLQKVKVNRPAEQTAEAKLLLGWLASRLSWGAAQDGFALRQEGRVRLDTADAERFSLELEGERHRVVVTAAALTASDDDLATAALGPRGADRGYQSALRRAVEFEP